ncbi:MAG: hypothetical protein COV57_01465 [Candidatus Liptonbacteria bacterium CG11_big_fil_rev_8_21_14_0_20_35_14]|uniref:Bacterial type II secretion system protein E domain-containing protein n=1 Tax=Candidatus Liptonbacteria bacterium CG11_big_fil_rev_8_21_14_0_20_35_14 TaxID=1974634 RepID=A0A2H0NA43_9BACT|nr:MAG: hypothetical protein COV57_01465 [Candidatus Liptonbacteria bacterium CG11_big_fil_rev_8_21_14_0_20_35_14]
MFSNNNTAVAERLIRFNQEAEERDAQRRASKLKKPYLNLIKTPIEIEALALIPKAVALENRIAVVNLVNKDLIVAVFDLSNPKIEEEVKKIESLGYRVQLFIVSESSLRHAFSFYQYVVKKGDDIVGKVSINAEDIELLKKTIKTVADLSKNLLALNFNSLPVAKLVGSVLGGAMALSASDVHFEPTKDGVAVRLRIDGVLQEVFGVQTHEFIPSDFYKQIVSRIKLLAGLKLNIRDEAQDGRFTIGLKIHDVEVRVAVAPSEFGEVMVLRILDPRAIQVGFSDLGFSDYDLKTIEQELKKPNGMILNTGPTGSGKTTTLYSFLRKVSTPENKVITIEDPIEYHLEGIEQTQVDGAANYTFALGLRSLMRQDPDVILVGEIRDEDTASIAVNAALTGHLVLSTLHTNNAAGAIARLVDLKVKENIITSAVNLVIAQRLVRKVCVKCAKKRELNSDEKNKVAKFLQKFSGREDLKKIKTVSAVYEVIKNNNCEACGGVGYKGRVGLFELMVIDDNIRKIVESEASLTDIEKIAVQNGMMKMQEDGIVKVLNGVTTFPEVERVTGVID